MWKKYRVRVIAVAAVVVVAWVYVGRHPSSTSTRTIPTKYPSSAGRQILLRTHSHVSKPRPLVLVLADEEMTAAQVEKASKVSTFADDHGFAVAYLDGIGGRWDPGPASRDPQFLVDAASYIETRTPIDPRRVYLWGLAEGGAEALRTACVAKPGVFAAVATVGPVGVVPARCVGAKNVTTLPGPNWGSSSTAFWKFSAPLRRG